MKIRVEIDEQMNEPEIVLHCPAIDGEVARIQTAILDALSKERKLTLVRDGRDYYLPAENILFFEAVDGKTWAHTAKNIYEIKLRLYELENILPASF
ncbi:LytTR family transcriptional regulator, partial [Candidatus Saccharibacteria bacterium]|nr:LytTR family transcriptional regulator [Candidatus Saccharibacteria bacterium]